MAHEARLLDDALNQRDTVTSVTPATDMVLVLVAGVVKQISATNLALAIDTTLVEDTIVNGVVDKAPSQNAVYDALALKADLASPALTGTPTAPTAAAATNTTQIATTAYVQTNLASYYTAAQVAAGFQPLNANLTAIAALTTTTFGRAFLTETDASTTRTTLGVTATGSDTTYAYRANNLSDLASASTARTNLGLGTAALKNTSTSGNNVPLLDGANTWSGDQAISNTSPNLLLIETDAPADETRWRFLASGGGLLIGGTNDAITVGFTAINIQRTGTTVDSIDFVTTTLTKNSVAIPTISSSDTLSNKTISSPTISGTVAGAHTYSGGITIQQSGSSYDLTVANTSANPQVRVYSSTTGTVSLFMGDTINEQQGGIQYNNATDTAYLRASNAQVVSIQVGNVTIATTGVPFNINSTNSNAYKLGFLDNGTVRGYLGADSTYALYVGNGSATTLTRWTHTNGLMEHLYTLSIGSSGIGHTIQNTTTDYQHTIDKDGTGVVFSTNSAVRGFRFVVNGTTEITWLGGVTVGAPTGGAKGAGTLNATAVYDDNTLLTDLVLDFAHTLTWDHKRYAKHPIATEIEEWWFDPDAYEEFWRNERHLPGMLSWVEEAKRPSTGEVITRLTAAVETQAVLISRLWKEISDLKEAA